MAKLADTARDPLPPSDVCSEPDPGPRLQPGQVIGERYRVEGVLGRGGMGIVYAAAHQHTGRAVALKLVECPWDDRRSELYQRFLGEARIASAIRHPNVVDVLDMGFHAGAPYLVMERLAGESLEHTLVQLEVLPLASTITWILPVMGALAALHDKGIVHRDLKPSNIFLSYDEGGRVVPKLLDFGLARVARNAPITDAGVLLGTPEYMAPERVRGQEVGAPADVWAMGVVLFECLCGKLPFTATNIYGIAAQIMGGDMLRARDANPRLPNAVAAVIDGALQYAPEQRHASMAQFAYALGSVALSAGLSVPPEPDPIGLPRFSALLVQNDPWISGPLAREFAAAAVAQEREASAPVEAAPPAPRRTRSRARLRLALLLALLLAPALMWGLHYARRAEPAAPRSRTAGEEPTLLPAQQPSSPSLPPPPAPPRPVEVAPKAAPSWAVPAAREAPPDREKGAAKRRERSRPGDTNQTDHSPAPAATDFEREWY